MTRDQHGERLAIVLNAEGALDDIDPDTLTEGEIDRVVFIRNGTAEGRAAIALLIRLADGRNVLAQTTYRLAHAAARAIAASPAAAEETP